MQAKKAMVYEIVFSKRFSYNLLAMFSRNTAILFIYGKLVAGPGMYKTSLTITLLGWEHLTNKRIWLVYISQLSWS